MAHSSVMSAAENPRRPGSSPGRRVGPKRMSTNATAGQKDPGANVEEFYCDECGRKCTRGPDGTEYGHRRGRDTRTPGRCSQRPECVDPDGVGWPR